jgi:hypothetical protein
LVQRRSEENGGTKPKQSLMPVGCWAPGNHEMSFRAKRGISLCVGRIGGEGSGRDSSLP